MSAWRVEYLRFNDFKCEQASESWNSTHGLSRYINVKFEHPKRKCCQKCFALTILPFKYSHIFRTCLNVL